MYRRPRAQEGGAGYSVAILAQVAILLTITLFGHILVLSLERPSVSLMDSVRLSQQTSQQTSFLPNQSQCTPTDVPVPDITINSQPSPISNTGSPYSGSVDFPMCPPVRYATGNGFTGTGVPARWNASLDVFLRDMSVRQSEQFTILTNSIASIPDAAQ